jgi:hypothetical protein
MRQCVDRFLDANLVVLRELERLRMARTTNVTVDAQMRLTMDNVRYGYGKAKCTALV